MSLNPTLAIDCTEEEAWQLTAPLQSGEEWRTLYLSDRSEDRYFLPDFRSICHGVEIAFFYRGDRIVNAQIMDKATPEEQRQAEGSEEGDPDACNHYRIDLESETYEILPPDHTSLHKDRLDAGPEFSRMERAFAAEWIVENDDSGHNRGTLQTLLRSCSKYDADRFTNWSPILLNDRERRIAATAIQWLGTNVGMAYLHRVNRTLDNGLAAALQCRSSHSETLARAWKQKGKYPEFFKAMLECEWPSLFKALEAITKDSNPTQP